MLPEYQIAEQRAVFKTTQIYGDTMKEVQKMNADKHSLGELRGMSKPPLDIEDLMAAVIMICKKEFLDVLGLSCLMPISHISVILWCSVLLVEETKVPIESHRPAAGH